jgi:hypothetical protein
VKAAQRRGVEQQRWQDPREINEDNLHNARREASRYFRHFSDAENIEINTPEPLVPSHLEVKIAIAKLQKYKSLGSYHFPAEWIHAREGVGSKRREN